MQLWHRLWQQHSPFRQLDTINKNWSIVFSGTAVRLGLGFAAGILIVRNLGVHDYGIYAILAAVIGIGGAIVDGGLSETAVKHLATTTHSQPSLAPRQSQIFWWLRLLLATTAIILGILLTPTLTTLLGIPDQQTLFIIALISIGTTVFNSTLNSFLQASNQFWHLSLVLITNSGLTLLIVLILVLTHNFTLTTAVWVGVIVSLAGFALARAFLPPAWRTFWHFPGWAALRQTGAGYLRYGRWLWLASLTTLLATQLDLFLVNHWLSATAVGLYGLALNLASKADIVNHSLRTVLLPAAATLHNQAAIKRYLRRSLRRSGFVGLGLLAILPLARWLIPILYGADFTSAVPLFTLLLGVVIIDSLLLPTTLLIYSFDKPHLGTIAALTQIITLFLLSTQLIPLWGAPGVIAARLSAKIVSFITLAPFLINTYRHLPITEGETPSTLSS